MQAAKEGRVVQLKVYDQFMSGAEANFVNHQGKDFLITYDKSVFDKEKKNRLQFDKDTILLDEAFACNDEAVLECLKDGADPNAYNTDGITCLHQACIENSLKIASIMVLNGADVNAQDNDWWTPLHAAAACGHWRLVNFLISNGGDPTIANADGDLPLDIVEGEKTGGILETEMKNRGVSEEQMDTFREKPHTRLMTQIQDIIKAKGDINAADVNGCTPLHAAACNGWMDCLELLLARKDVNLNAKDIDGNTALHLSSFFQQYRSVEALGKAGADANARNNENQPPIVLSEDVTMIRLLKALRTAQPGAAEDEEEHVGNRKRSVRRRSVSDRRDLAKTDSLQEGASLQSMQEAFINEHGPLDGDDSATLSKSEYASLDFQGEEGGDAPAKSAGGETPYATIVTPAAGDNGGYVEGQGNAFGRAPLGESTLLKKAQLVNNPKAARKGSLAAIAVEDIEGSAAPGADEDEVPPPPPPPVSNDGGGGGGAGKKSIQPDPADMTLDWRGKEVPRKGKEKKDGGCCVVS